MLFHCIMERNLNVRQAENLAKKMIQTSEKRDSRDKSPEVLAMETKLQQRIGTKVKMTYAKGKGKIVIDYYNDEDLERILGMLQVQ